MRTFILLISVLFVLAVTSHGQEVMEENKDMVADTFDCTPQDCYRAAMTEEEIPACCALNSGFRDYYDYPRYWGGGQRRDYPRKRYGDRRYWDKRRYDYPRKYDGRRYDDKKLDYPRKYDGRRYDDKKLDYPRKYDGRRYDDKKLDYPRKFDGRRYDDKKLDNPRKYDGRRYDDKKLDNPTQRGGSFRGTRDRAPKGTKAGRKADRKSGGGKTKGGGGKTKGGGGKTKGGGGGGRSLDAADVDSDRRLADAVVEEDEQESSQSERELQMVYGGGLYDGGLYGGIYGYRPWLYDSPYSGIYSEEDAEDAEDVEEIQDAEEIEEIEEAENSE